MSSDFLWSFFVARRRAHAVIRPRWSTYSFTINEFLLPLASFQYAMKAHRPCFATIVCRGVDSHFEGEASVPICLFLSWDCRSRTRRWQRLPQHLQIGLYVSTLVVVIAVLLMAFVRVQIVKLCYSHYEYEGGQGCWRGWYSEQV